MDETTKIEQPEQEQTPRFLKGPIFAGDRVLWVIVAMLMTFSLLVVYSATNSKAYVDAGGDTAHYFMKQLQFIVLGLAVMWFVHRFNYQTYASFAKIAFVVALGMQLLTFFVGVTRNDAARALPIMGLTIQPSDFLKVALVLVLARELAKRQTIIDKIDILPSFFTSRKKRGKRTVEFDLDVDRNMKTLTQTTIPLLLPMAITCLTVFPSNLSTAGIIFVSCLIMLFIGRVKMSEVVKLFTIVAVVGLVGIYTMSAFNIARARTWTGRINGFFSIEKVIDTPAASALTVSSDDEQADNAKIAIASGGFFGKGPGHSTQRARLSHSYSDFAYAFIVEEYGFVGAMVVLMLYLWLFFRTIVIFQRCGTAFPSFLVLGLGLMIFLQAAVNMLVSTGLFFVTGQNLPLVSMGGSSVLFISLALGMILGVSRQMQEQTLDQPKGESLLEK